MTNLSELQAALKAAESQVKLLRAQIKEQSNTDIIPPNHVGAVLAITCNSSLEYKLAVICGGQTMGFFINENGKVTWAENSHHKIRCNTLHSLPMPLNWSGKCVKWSLMMIL